MAAISDLSVKITANTGDAERSINSVEEQLGDLNAEAIQTAAALQLLQGAADETADELDDVEDEADQTSRSLLGLASAAATAKLSFGSLSVATAGGLAVSLATLATTLAPVAAGFVAVTAGAGALLGAFGALLGAGLLAWGRDLADQMAGVSSATEALAKVAGQLRDRLIPIIKPLGDAFVPLLQDAALALPVVVEEMVSAVGSTEEFRRSLREFGYIAARVLPALTGFMFDFARKALPVARDFFGFLLNNGRGAFQSIMASVRELAPEFNAFLDALIKGAPVLLEFGTNVLDVLLPALTSIVELSTGFMSFINGLPPGLRDVATAGLILAPVLTSLALKFASLYATLTGGGVLAAISGSGGLAGALTALTGPVGIAIAAVGLLATAWATNMFDMREKTKEAVGAINEDLRQLPKNPIDTAVSAFKEQASFYAKGGTATDSRYSVTGEQDTSGRESGEQAADQTTDGYLQQLKKLQSKDFSKSFLSPSNFQTQGEQAGAAAAQGFQRGLSKTEMQAEVIGQQQELASLRLMFKEAQSLPRKKELLDRIQAIRNPPNMNESKPHNAIQRRNLGAKPSSKPSAMVSRGSPIVQAGQTFNQSSTRIKNVGQTFKSAVDKFSKAVENMEVVVTVEDGEFAQAIDARFEQNSRQTAQQAQNYGAYQR